VASHPGAAVSAQRLNGLLPDDVAVVSSEGAPEGFDARRDARSRTYRYRVLTRAARSPQERRTSLHWRRACDRDALHACAAALVGKHDFTAFTPTGGYHSRFTRQVTRSEWVDRGDLVDYWIEADSFMRHMVRTLVGSMLWVAAGRMEREAFEGLLEGRPREEAPDTAPAHGLCLESVSYD
jgi:tRNA pseudouridine38-40 synthase